MKNRFVILAIAFSIFAVKAQSQERASLKLIQTFKLPPQVEGNFDYFAIDLKGGRLFAAPEAYEAALVLDLTTGKVIHKISGIEIPRPRLDREDLNHPYLTDGEAGDMKIFNGTSCRLLSSAKLLEDAASIGYDSATRYPYIDNGRGDIHQMYSMRTVVGTSAEVLVFEVH
jgi:hypothetical protein